ncbi:uncharacterized protein [Pyxicephalus adspersus]|uniref:uncharacterized protein n=1 Tax=Pyxicephalus adspersus TaxID=30357 RepID=UPI003B5A6BE9
MSDGKGHLHLRLNYAEELRNKKELERLLKPPQRTVKQDMVDFRSSSPLSLMPGSALSQFKQLYSTSRPRPKVTSRLAQPTCQSPSASDLPQGSMAYISVKEDQKVGQIVKSAVPSLKDDTQELKEEKCLQNDHLSLSHEHLLENDHREQRPAITPMVGTTKPISIFQRPRPPAKLRSTMPQRSPKPRVSVKPTVVQQKVTRIKKVRRVPSSEIQKAVDERSSDSSSISNSSSSSDSEDSDDSEKRARSTGKKKKKRLKKMNMLATPDQEYVDVGSKTPSALLSEPPYTSSTYTSSVCQNHELDGTTKQAAEEINPTYLMPPMKATARSVDEIIASLRSPQAHTESEMMIKHLMESVLGLNYSIPYGKAEEERNVTHEPEIPQSVLDDQKWSPGESPSSQQHSLLDPDTDIRLTDSKLSTELSFTDKDEEKTVQQTSILDGENGTTPVQEEEMTDKEAKQVLRSAAQVTISDIIHVKGDAVSLTRRETARTHPPVALLATWKPRTKSAVHQTIHHLCTVSPSQILPSSLQLASRVQHTMNRKGHCTDFEVSYQIDSLPDDPEHRMRILQDGILTSTLPSHDQRGGLVTLPPHSARSLEEWQRIAEYYVERPRMELIAEHASLNPETLKMFWAPAPPKFSAPLSLMQQTLFSKYEARVLSRRHNSLPNFDFSTRSTSKLKKTLSASAPNISILEESKFHLLADFQTSMKELAVWRQQHYKTLEVVTVCATEEREKQNSEILPGVSAQTTLPIDQVQYLTSAGVAAVPQPSLKPSKKKKYKRKGHLDPKKLQIILHKLKQPPRTLKRSVSAERMPLGSRPTYHLRSSSLPRQLDFTSFLKTQGGVQAGQDLREWVRDIWNNWFDEVFPPSRASMEDESQHFDNIGPVTQHDTEKKEDIPWTAGLDSVLPVLVEDPTTSVLDVEREIYFLTSLIEKQERPSAFHYCRRGALHRKLGNVCLALQDLDMVIKQEPQLLDAYWHRHLIFLLQGKTNEALDDLNYIIKYNKTNAG